MKAQIFFCIGNVSLKKFAVKLYGGIKDVKPCKDKKMKMDETEAGGGQAM
jgi:hypothetical protein